MCSGRAWRVSAGENVDTLSTDNSFGEFGCEGKKALTGGEYRVSFMFCFLKILFKYIFFDCIDLCQFRGVESYQGFNETQKILKRLC